MVKIDRRLIPVEHHPLDSPAVPLRRQIDDALEKRSAEVWQVLGAVKTEFANFAGVLDKTRKKLQEASNTIDAAQTRANVMTRTLRTVEALPVAEAQALLPPAAEGGLDPDSPDGGPAGA